jgi:hypothetical protein
VHRREAAPAIELTRRRPAGGIHGPLLAGDQRL